MPTQEGVRVAIITGASSGIGRSAAIRIAERGAGVIVTFNTDSNGAQDTASAIEKIGGMAIALHLDVGRSETFPGFVDRAAAEMHRRWNRTTFDFLVNNAGFGKMAMFEDTTEELLDEFYRVSLKGPYFLTQKLLPLLVDGGAIVNTTSNSALTTGLSAGYSAYGSMKGGLMALTRYMAKEFSGRRIRVNSVAPGPTRTRIAHKGQSSPVRSSGQSRHADGSTTFVSWLGEIPA